MCVWKSAAFYKRMCIWRIVFSELQLESIWLTMLQAHIFTFSGLNGMVFKFEYWTNSITWLIKAIVRDVGDGNFMENANPTRIIWISFVICRCKQTKQQDFIQMRMIQWKLGLKWNIMLHKMISYNHTL